MEGLERSFARGSPISTSLLGIIDGFLHITIVHLTNSAIAEVNINSRTYE
jgi:hypothetical protein